MTSSESRTFAAWHLRRGALLAAALLAAAPVLAAPPAVKVISPVSGEAVLSGQEPLQLQLLLDAPATEDLKVPLRASSVERVLLTLPTFAFVPKGSQRATFQAARMPAAFASNSNQTVIISAATEGQRGIVKLPVVVRGGFPDVPAPCDSPQAYRLSVQGTGSIPAPTRTVAGAFLPVATVSSGDPYTVSVTLDCAVRTALVMPLTLHTGPGTSVDPLLTNAERVAGIQAAFAHFPASLQVPANQRGVSVTVTAGDSLLGGIGRIQGPASLLAVSAPQSSDTLRILSHPRCLHTFTLIAPTQVTSGGNLRPRISRPCVSPEVGNVAGQYEFAFETSDAIALPVPLSRQLIRDNEYNDQRTVRTLTAGSVSAPTRVELRVVRVSGPVLAAPIAPVSIMVVPR